MSYVEHLRIMVLEKIPRATETFGQTWGTEYSVSGKVKSGNRINSLTYCTVNYENKGFLRDTSLQSTGELPVS